MSRYARRTKHRVRTDRCGFDPQLFQPGQHHFVNSCGGVESASHSNGETAALAAALATIASAKIAVEIYFINSSPLVTVALGKSDSLDLHQQVGPANIRRYINGRHRPNRRSHIARHTSKNPPVA
jgi:hypothetical protein